MKVAGRLFMGVSLFALAACNDFLDEEPQSDVSPEQYLWSEDQLKAYVDNYYADYDNYDGDSDDKGGMLPRHYGSENGSPYYDDDATDNQQGTNGRYLQDTWTVGQTGGKWNFTNIYALNYFIETVTPRYEEGSISGSAENIEQYLGEAHFLRALEYFYRLRTLGDFPIVENTLSDNMEELTEASVRKPRNEVARFILEDLDKAIELTTNSPAKTRITRNAALVLKSRVALFEATWEKYHAGTALVPNGSGWPGAEKEYGQNYQFPNDEGTAEGEINFFLDEAMDAASQVADAVELTSNNKTMPDDGSANDYYDMFASHDPSEYSEVIMYREYSLSLNATHHFNHYMYHGGNTGYTAQFEKAFLMENGLPWYDANSGYAGDDYISDTKTGRDWRWQLFMKAPGDVKATENITTPETFPTAPRVYISDSRNATSTGYIQGKGHSMDYNDQVLGQDQTAFVVYRAAEAYLNYIEASYLRYGNLNDTKLDTYWRKLRQRAGVDEDYNSTIAATDMAQEAENDWGAYSHGQIVDATLYNIRRERRCEFIGEGFRYMDLIRWRAMDQLNGYQLKGAKIFGPMEDLFVDSETGESLLKYDQADEADNNVSSPSDGDYLLPNRKTSTNEYYNGFYFFEAHYLYPIAVQHFLITSSDGASVDDSPIYQNPGWPIVSGATCE
ncbi:RagB/SusD family nutrient uptake outer membrane protein [Bacteroides gallinaceum]|uniref:RagB/SusD family nutrient uptake outer membrane protein n=1 Tax=Bacteroides gallinaceum TaxID=1462571 RepID=UPI0025A3872D|nr:RagB/SusD family nutrient uptake outer membrane protein [Bacteroides gallinaceum]MDM8207690.1 RagB/SusD family nutrient uptake outer membrane protein [Bacteroides gallinaceum]